MREIGKVSASPARLLLRTPFFLGLILTAWISNLGSWMQGFSEQWVVVRLAGPEAAAWSGRLSFATGLAVLLLTPFGGVLADRFDRRRLLALSQFWLALLALGMGLLAWTGALTLGRLLTFALCTGMGIAAMGPAFHALLPDLVPAEHLAAGSGLMSLQFNLSRMMGPALAAALMPLVGVAGNFLLNSLSFVGLIVLSLRLPAPSRREHRDTASYREALAACRQDPELSQVMLLSVLAGLFAWSYHAFVALYATRYLGLGAHGAAGLLAAYGLGALVGSVVVARDQGGNAWPRLRGGFAMYAVLLTMLGTLPHPHLSPVVVCGMGICHALFANHLSIVVQRRAPQHLRGRINALYFTAILGLMPLGNLLAGEVAQRLGYHGVRWVLGAQGLLILSVVLSLKLPQALAADPDRLES